MVAAALCLTYTIFHLRLAWLIFHIFVVLNLLISLQELLDFLVSMSVLEVEERDCFPSGTKRKVMPAFIFTYSWLHPVFCTMEFLIDNSLIIVEGF